MLFASKVGRVYPGKPWPKSKSVRDIQDVLEFAYIYRRFIQGFSQIAAPLTSMLKTSGSTESTTRPRKGRVGVGGDGGETLISRLRTSISTDSSTKTTQIAIEYDRVDGSVGKSAEELSKSQRIIKKSEKPQRPEKLQKSLVWKNIYRSTDLPLKNSSFC